MKAALAALALVLAALPAAAQRCPDGGEPLLTGQPFRPLACSASDASQGPAVAVSTAARPDPDPERADLRGLDGEWRGSVSFGAGRFDVTLIVSGRGAHWRWQALNELSHLSLQLDGELTRGLFSKPPYKLSLKSPAVPDRALTGEIWLGATPLEAGKHPVYDRLAVWTFAGRAPLQKVAYTLEGDRLRGAYALVDGDKGPVSTGFDLTRRPKK